MKTWFVKCEDGKAFSERSGSAWQDVLNHNSKIEKLHLVIYDFFTGIIQMPEQCTQYSQSKTASCNISGGPIEVESHNLEALFVANGPTKLKVSVSEKTGDIDITLEDVDSI